MCCITQMTFSKIPKELICIKTCQDMKGMSFKSISACTPTVDVQHQPLGGRCLCSLIIENESKEKSLIFDYYECPSLCQEDL